jgi:hypothetical protein
MKETTVLSYFVNLFVIAVSGIALWVAAMLRKAGA